MIVFILKGKFLYFKLKTPIQEIFFFKYYALIYEKKIITCGYNVYKLFKNFFFEKTTLYIKFFLILRFIFKFFLSSFAFVRCDGSETYARNESKAKKYYCSDIQCCDRHYFISFLLI